MFYHKRKGPFHIMPCFISKATLVVHGWSLNVLCMLHLRTYVIPSIHDTLYRHYWQYGKKCWQCFSGYTNSNRWWGSALSVAHSPPPPTPAKKVCSWPCLCLAYYSHMAAFWIAIRNMNEGVMGLYSPLDTKVINLSNTLKCFHY